MIEKSTSVDQQPQLLAVVIVVVVMMMLMRSGAGWEMEQCKPPEMRAYRQWSFLKRKWTNLWIVD
jgi:hypothetical protein